MDPSLLTTNTDWPTAATSDSVEPESEGCKICCPFIFVSPWSSSFAAKSRATSSATTTKEGTSKRSEKRVSLPACAFRSTACSSTTSTGTLTNPLDTYRAG
ncbi:hypothetical protein CPC08DRAFT_560043 [Agrocybe pediades]|nr:hypothetical protein CPC08DRAFT_560043 [Agrocybe pediades]